MPKPARKGQAVFAIRDGLQRPIADAATLPDGARSMRMSWTIGRREHYVDVQLNADGTVGVRTDDRVSVVLNCANSFDLRYGD
jgi:hypothetical protein